MNLSLNQLEALIRNVPDFPRPGILFKDITPVLREDLAFKSLIHLMSEKLVQSSGEKPNIIVGIESRGFILGSAIAHHLGIGFVPVRKPGKLPYKTIQESYSLEYGTDFLAMHVDALKPTDKVVIVDDLIATGGTAKAAISLSHRLDAKILGVLCFIELAFLKGASKLGNIPLWALSRVE